MISILSIDGGGIRGIIPAIFLAEIEKKTGQPACELFDLIAGTSTGGLLAATLTLPDHSGKSKYSAKQICDLYSKHGSSIFSRTLFRSVTSLGGLIRPAYSSRPLELILKQYLGDARLDETLTEVLITAYDMGSSTPWFFKTSFAKNNYKTPVDNPLLTQVVRATTAAPTYFPPLIMEDHCLIDGGVFASNPALCAYAQARTMFPEEHDFLLLSLGTGLQVNKWSCANVNNWGIVGWAVPISDVVLNSSSASVNYQMMALISESNYIRFQVKIDDDAKIDDASKENIKSLESTAHRAVREQSTAINRICRTLSQKSLK